MGVSFSGSGAASGAAAGSSFGPWGTLIGGLVGAFANKKKAAPTAPFVATPTIDAQGQQKQAIQGNLDVQPSLEELLSRSNRFQQGQASDMLEQAVPGYGKLSSAITKSATDKLNDPYALPPEVQKNLQRIAAEKGVNVGTHGETRSFSALRDLGVNMLDYGNSNFQQALQGLQTVTGVAPRVSPMSPLSFLLNSGQQLGIAGQNSEITRANNAGQQATTQGGSNAETAAQNFNTNNMWTNLLQMMGQMDGEGGWAALFGGGSKKPANVWAGNEGDA